MARISLTQAINLNIVVMLEDKPVPKTLELKRGVNEVDPEILHHPYILAHMNAGLASIVPDPMDPEDIAKAAEEIARKARAEADAAKALKAVKQKEIDDAIAAASKPPDAPKTVEPAVQAQVDAPKPVSDASKEVPAATEEAGAATKPLTEDEEFEQLLAAEAAEADAAKAETPAS